MLAFVASAWVILAIAIATAPDHVRTICAKEGPCEIVSHVVLGAAIVGFGAAAVQARPPARAWALALVAIACTVVLGEELDWGAVLGVRLLADPLERGLGSANVHNAARGHSYVLFAIAAPVVAMVALGRGAWAERWRARLGRCAPSKDDGVAVLVVLGVALGVAILAPRWDAVVDEVAELLGYGILLARCMRPNGSNSGLSSSTYS